MHVLKNKYLLLCVALFAAIGLQTQFQKEKAIATVPYINTRVSTDSTGAQQTGGGLGNIALSKDGRYVAFSSTATNLVPADTNGFSDVFVKDALTGSITRADVSTSGTEANKDVQTLAISYTGRFIVFDTTASTLIVGDNNGRSDVYLHDMQTGTTELISANTTGGVGNHNSSTRMNSISKDGRYVVFSSIASNLISSDTNGVGDVFVRDRKLGTTTRLSTSASGTEANNGSDQASISCDGSTIVFRSQASNLTAGDTNNAQDIFMVNRIGAMEVDDVTTSGNNDSGSALVSCDGSTISFDSSATNLVAGDTNAQTDVFSFDRSSSTIARESVSSSGTQANGSTSNLSGDGRYIVFGSDSASLVSGDTNGVQDIFLRDRISGTTERVSMRSSSVEATAFSFGIGISPDGSNVGYGSTDAGLVTGDTNGQPDAFVSQTGATPCAL